MAGKTNVPIIIRRKKAAAAGGHHGGAWKVAYADFVTAMMAFFMLLWMLNATTEQQRQGIADYFNPTVTVNRISGGGNGALDGDSVFTEDILVQNGVGATMEHATEQDKARGETGADRTADAEDQGDTRQRLKQLEEHLMGTGGESMVSRRLLRHVVTRQTDEGLIVELFDLPGAPLFRDGSGESTDLMRELVAELSQVFALVTNEIAVRGHIAARPIVMAKGSPWDLSMARADATRQMLHDSDPGEGRVQRVEGYADRQPVARNPMAPRNSRIEIVLLRDAGRR